MSRNNGYQKLHLLLQLVKKAIYLIYINPVKCTLLGSIGGIIMFSPTESPDFKKIRFSKLLRAIFVLPRFSLASF